MVTVSVDQFPVLSQCSYCRVINYLTFSSFFALLVVHVVLCGSIEMAYWKGPWIKIHLDLLSACGSDFVNYFIGSSCHLLFMVFR